MKLIRFGEKGKERPGLLRGEKVVDLRRIFPEIPDICDRFFREGWLEKIAGVAEAGEEMAVRLSHPVHRPSKIICLGKNYAEHAREGGFDAPERPLLFSKAPSALNGPFDPIRLPRFSGRVDWEVELAVVIGREGKRIAPEAAFDYVAGYTVMNDVSGREAQFGDGQWFRGKSFDTFAPLGPALLTPDEIGDVDGLRLTSLVNGEVMQEGTTRDLIFDIPTLIAYISQDMTLMPGDIISTGTPAGVGIFRDPPVTLMEGDVVECRIDPLGALVNRCEA
jgi:2-keto-4-pentenoate hydratase/2-oxohepta-3-ene-1,7-dioic acid hydratase in catechol pathway